MARRTVIESDGAPRSSVRGEIPRSPRARLAIVIAVVLVGCGGGSGEGGGDGIAAGYAHACALRAGKVSCWGSNTQGQLGDASTAQRERAVPVRGLSGALAIAAGSSHSCAARSDGVVCWGNNADSRLGNAALEDDHSATPVRVDGLSARVDALAAGAYHTCALLDGAVKCWGDNTLRQLGTTTGTESTTPLQIPGLEAGVQAIAAGETHTCALLNGGVKCWGDGLGGVLGDGSSGAHTRATPYDAIAAGNGATAVAAGPATTCALVDGNVRCWGRVIGGMSGTGCAASICPTPVVLTAAPAGTTSLAVSEANVYLLANGGVKAVGADGSGELGDGDPFSGSTSLVDVSGLTSGVAAVSGASAFACALLESRAVRCWGLNAQRQLGDETTTNRSAPVLVHAL